MFEKIKKLIKSDKQFEKETVLFLITSAIFIITMTVAVIILK